MLLRTRLDEWELSPEVIEKLNGEKLQARVLVRRRPGKNRVTWKTPSRAAFVPLQEPVAVLAILRSPHANAGMKQYECGRTQPLFRACHDGGITCVD